MESFSRPTSAHNITRDAIERHMSSRELRRDVRQASLEGQRRGAALVLRPQDVSLARSDARLDPGGRHAWRRRRLFERRTTAQQATRTKMGSVLG